MRIHTSGTLTGMLLFALTLVPFHSGCSDGPTSPPTPQNMPSEVLEWTWRNPLPQGNNLQDVFFADANKATAVGANGTILHTTDGETSWSFRTSGSHSLLNAVFYTDATNGTIVGNDGVILRTADVGITWIAQDSGTTQTLRAVFFTDAINGFVVGHGGTMLHTTDGGMSWNDQSLATDRAFFGIHFVDPNIGTVVGSSGLIYRTTNGGSDWTSQDSGTNRALLDVCFTDVNNGTAVGTGTIIRTTDGGNTWVRQIPECSDCDPDEPFPILESYMDVSFADALTGAIVSDAGRTIRTIDGGETWQVQKGNVSVALNGVHFTGANTGFAVGSMGAILRASASGE